MIRKGSGTDIPFQLGCRCFELVGVPDHIKVPKINLPVHVDILFRDKPKNSTSIHAKLLAPDHVTITNFADVPTQVNIEETVVIYPTQDAGTFFDLQPPELSQLKRLILIDAPWKKAAVMVKHPALESVRKIKLASPPSTSKFWRYHSQGAGCISTIEALKCILLEFSQATKDSTSSTESSYDPLMYFFNLQALEIEAYHAQNQIDDSLLPMNEHRKAQMRSSRNQVDKGKRLHQEFLDHKRDQQADIHVEERCFNCREFGHKAQECPNPCRYCHETGHWNRQCTKRQKKD